MQVRQDIVRIQRVIWDHLLAFKDEIILKQANLVPRVSHLTAPLGERGELSLLAPGGGKMGDPGNEVGSKLDFRFRFEHRIIWIIHAWLRCLFCFFFRSLFYLAEVILSSKSR